MKANKFTSFLFVFLLTLSRLAAQPQQSQQQGGADSPFPITSEHESAYVAEQVNAGNPDYVAAPCELTNDLDLEPYNATLEGYISFSGTNTDGGVPFRANGDGHDRSNATPTHASKSADGITVNPVSCTANNGQSVAYSISPAPDTLPSARQAFTAFFSNLQPNFVYHVYARTKESANHNAGVALMSIPVTTNATSPDLTTPPGGDPQDNGAQQPVAVTGTSGMATITVFYDNATTVPVNAGTCAVTVDIAESSLYKTTTGIAHGDYVTVEADGASVTYAPALSAKTSRQITVGPVNNAATNGQTGSGGGSVTVPDYGSTIIVDPSSSDGVRIIPVPDASNLSYPNPASAVYTGAPQPVIVTGTSGMGTITVLYDGQTSAPVASAVTVDVTADNEYESKVGIALGDYVTAEADGASVTYALALSAKASRQITVHPVADAATNGRTVESRHGNRETFKIVVK